MAKLLDGKILAQEISEQLKLEVDEYFQKYKQRPFLVNIIVGDDPGSCSYANSQKKAAEKIGIQYQLNTHPLDVSQETLEMEIQLLNSRRNIHGLMLHKPVPSHIDYNLLANHVDIDKDLEGINVGNIGKMILGETNIIPCTPAAIMEHIRSTGVNLRGKEAVIVGHSGIVGKPLSLLLLEELATVTICHLGTHEAGKLEEHVRRAEILIVAVGKPEVIKGDWVKDGAIVIDVGINKVGNQIVGDVEFDPAQKKAAFITPVPGGVGPVTVVMLMRNGLQAFKKQLLKQERN